LPHRDHGQQKWVLHVPWRSPCGCSVPPAQGRDYFLCRRVGKACDLGPA
jgi:hypothetical protein